ncbi:indole-3-glycerol phosphate synthase TrpC [Altibacter sp. HG106]|uniref:indole-3-glycerol phosphate synthase TrpC n=1 Tax=Altibacter sp. HG106 TaxID=3023937 RepID=UPI00235103BF|nr:indole-3-glycerol phosphate synthase TrpC [Altibacter sp. HG106]MDC7996162.1 indole-3-glycerol phosphate synthase TrpC [Altibacter sp. HG106]
MTILEHITQYKKQEVAAAKEALPLKVLGQSPYFDRSCQSLSEALKNSSTGIIAEHKRRSPSKQVINNQAPLPEVVAGYAKAGVSGISILTDTKFFGGSLTDLCLARQTVSLPLLRKDFVVDEYQLYEAKAFGADAVLLIAACLSDAQLETYTTLANTLGLEVLLEIHNAEELERSKDLPVAMMGVNNRNLKTFEVNVAISEALVSMIPEQMVRITESGISDASTVTSLRLEGYQGFLMGEHFMKQQDPGVAANNFIQQLP